jgi:hypothetical protein
MRNILQKWRYNIPMVLVIVDPAHPFEKGNCGQPCGEDRNPIIEIDINCASMLELRQNHKSGSCKSKKTMGNIRTTS